MEENLIIKIKICNNKSKVPTKAKQSDSGWDLYVVKIIEKGNNVYFADTGIQIQPPKGYFTQIVPRSSIYKTNFILANSIGIIDEGYRGNLMIPLRYISTENNGLKEAEQLIGQKIAQLLLIKNYQSEIKVVKELEESDRGSLGFGSSGK